AVSSNFPVTQGALQRQYGGGGSDAFVTKLGPSGSLAYSTYLGGQGFDHGESLAVDGGGSVYLTGYTASRDFPTAHPYQAALNGPLDVFVARMNEAGAALIYSTYLGGAGPEGGVSVAVDASGNAYVAGATQSPDFPATQGAVQVSFRGEQDGFLTKLSPEGTAVLFSTYLGGTKADSATGVAVDAEGNSYVVGSTRSPDFLVVDAFQAAHAGNDEVFIAKVNAAGSAFIHSSFLGGSGWDLGYAIAVDKSGNIYVTGRTDSADFPTLNAYQAVNKGNRDAFVARIAEGASSATFFTVSAASFASAAPLAAEAIAAGYGANLVPAIDIAPAAGPLPIVLGEVSVKVRDGAGVERTAPLWFVSPGQINYYIPEVTALGLATITVTRGSQIIASGRLQIDRVAPGLFAANSNGQGVAAALAIYKSGQPWQYVFNVGCTVGSCRPVPIDLGLPSEQVYLQLYGTGIRGRSSLAAVTATIGGVAAAVEYAGPVEGMVGLDQVNLPVPRSLIGRGTVDIVLTVDGKTTNAVTVGVK
ncbi:MAG TPA: SBBP repeat-containing protein, partial [Bryobacteraceae bacterium]|nr:SBBP repeat-containing protein [Bryobacteraceae bacterium]